MIAAASAAWRCRRGNSATVEKNLMYRLQGYTLNKGIWQYPIDKGLILNSNEGAGFPSY